MRDIKFRMWNPINNIMEQPVFNIKDLMKGRVFNQEEIETFVPLMFTGLFDKQGKEIYEGDIVEVEEVNSGFICQVTFTYGCFGIESEEYGLKYAKDWFVNKNSIKVIGNIYENPGLLK